MNSENASRIKMFADLWRAVPIGQLVTVKFIGSYFLISWFESIPSKTRVQSLIPNI